MSSTPGTVHVDSTRCEGYGNCVLHAPSHFDLDDSGYAVVLKSTAEGEELEAVRRAVYDCPTEAITVTE